MACVAMHDRASARRLGAAFGIERRLDRASAWRRARAACPPARGRGGCGASWPMTCTSVWRLPRCQARRARSPRGRRVISISGSGRPTTCTSRPSSSTSPSPSRSITARQIEQEFGAALAVVSTMRRRCRSPASSTTRSTAAAGSQLSAGLIGGGAAHVRTGNTAAPSAAPRPARRSAARRRRAPRRSPRRPRSSGVAPLCIMSSCEIRRGCSSPRRAPSGCRASCPDPPTAALETNTTEDAVSALPKAPNIGR